MNHQFLRTTVCAAGVALTSPCMAAGDLLVAPTRILLDGARGTEIVLNNVGSVPATYRITLELKRMTPDGRLEDVVPGSETAKEKATLAMISYAPRRVTLAPNQPQVVRIGARLTDDMPTGEYRAHLLFRAIPDALPVSEKPSQGVSIALTPVYGVTIPVIVRKGALQATAQISDVHLGNQDGSPTLDFRLTRNGDRSVYGRIRVTRPGIAKPLYEARGLAVYAEISGRTVALPLTKEAAASMNGPVKVEYLEDNDAGGLIAETQAVLR